MENDTKNYDFTATVTIDGETYGDGTTVAVNANTPDDEPLWDLTGREFGLALDANPGLGELLDDAGKAAMRDAKAGRIPASGRTYDLTETLPNGKEVTATVWMAETEILAEEAAI